MQHRTKTHKTRQNPGTIWCDFSVIFCSSAFLHFPVDTCNKQQHTPVRHPETTGLAGDIPPVSQHFLTLDTGSTRTLSLSQTPDNLKNLKFKIYRVHVRYRYGRSVAQERHIPTDTLTRHVHAPHGFCLVTIANLRVCIFCVLFDLFYTIVLFRGIIIIVVGAFSQVK